MQYRLHARALRPYFSDAQIVAIATGRFEGVLEEAEQVMLHFARQVARDASQVTAAQVAALRSQGFTEAEIFDIAATAAGRAFFTKVLDALGVEPDSPFGALDEAFRSPLTVGRTIDPGTPTRMEEERRRVP